MHATLLYRRARRIGVGWVRAEQVLLKGGQPIVVHVRGGVGRVVRTLKQENLWENTLLFFFTDNGGAKAMDVLKDIEKISPGLMSTYWRLMRVESIIGEDPASQVYVRNKKRTA